MQRILNLKGGILIFLSSIAFGSYGTWGALVGTNHGIIYPGWTRALMIAVVLLPILYATKQLVPIDRRDWKWLSVFIIATSFTQAPVQYAFTHMNIGAASTLFFASMLLTMYAFGFLFLREQPTWIKVVSFVLAGAGLAIAFSFSLVGFALLAACMALLNGVASGLEVASSKKLTGSYSALYMTWLSWVAVAITNAVVSIAIGESQAFPHDSLFWLYQVGYAGTGLMAFWLVIEGLKHVEASIGGLLGLLEIVFSIIFAFLVFGQMLTVHVMLGAVLIIIAAALPHVVDLVNGPEKSSMPA